jgi:adenylate kinase family enzyme
MKIAILGYSGSGKSTLASFLGKRHELPVLHLDSIQFLPKWEIRDKDDRAALYRRFLAEHPNEWVIDGNYKALDIEKRLEEADVILILLFPRLLCLWRCFKRYRANRNRVRESMAEGCEEKLDAEFIRWILWESRTAKHRAYYRSVIAQYSEKVTVLKSQRQIDRYMRTL